MITPNVSCAKPNNHCNLNHSDFRIHFARNVFHGSESALHLKPKIWDMVCWTLILDTTFWNVTSFQYYHQKYKLLWWKVSRFSLDYIKECLKLINSVS